MRNKDSEGRQGEPLDRHAGQTPVKELGKERGLHRRVSDAPEFQDVWPGQWGVFRLKSDAILE